MTGPTALEKPVALTREDLWERHPQPRLQELAREVRELQEQVARANRSVREASATGTEHGLWVARLSLSHLEDRLLQRRRYVVTFRREHRV